MISFKSEEMLFAPEASTVASKLPILVYYPMAWDHDRNSIPAIRRTDGPNCSFATNNSGHFLIRAGLSIRNPQQLVPHAFLERSAGKNQRHGKLLEPTREIFFKFTLQRLEVFVLPWNDGAGKEPFQCAELRLQHPAIGELEQADTVFRRCGDERAKRAFEPRYDDAIDAAACAGGTSECSAECIPESAIVLITISQRDVIQGRSSAKLIERFTHPARPAVRLKCHPIVLQEKSADAIWIDTGRA